VHKEDPHISVVIVNYKVKEYIANLLNSLKKAQHNFGLEIFVVDNASGDDSIPYLRERYPDVNYITNDKNLGFAKANNQAIRKAQGEYTLIINPDTLVSEDTLDVLVTHMEENPACGAAGCKILNPDGSFAKECRRSIPDLKAALFRVLGLDAMFPESKVFGKRYLGWLAEDEPSEVPVLSGSFMFWRTDLLKNLGGFDEDFFMYGEDDDLCFRVQETPYKIQYVPKTSIIHYKGESSKKGDLKHIRVFNKALYKFFKKHYSTQYSLFFRGFIYAAVWFKIISSFIVSSAKKVNHVITDLVLLNVSIVIGFGIRFALKGTNIFTGESLKYLWINALASIVYLFIGSVRGMYKERKKSIPISVSLKSLTATYLGVVIITFFVRNLAYSRLALIFGFIAGVILFFTYKLYEANRKGINVFTKGRIKNQRVIVVGDVNPSAAIISKIHSRPDWSYEVVGNITVKEIEKENVALGSLSQLKDLVKAYNIDQVLFVLHSISYKQMLKEISNLQEEDVVFKLIPDSMDFILGKSHVEYLESIPLVEVEFEFTKPINKFIKRFTDLAISTPFYLLLFLFVWPSVLFGKKDVLLFEDIKLYSNLRKNKWKNRLRLLGYVITGRLSLVGKPIVESDVNTSGFLKKGITGLVQISQNRIQNSNDAESFSLYYLQNYSLWMDIDILIKTIFNGPNPLEVLAKSDPKS
jgi:GT2 family glycosyltransferase